MIDEAKILTPRLKYLLAVWLIICVIIMLEMMLDGYMNVASKFTNPFIIAYFIVHILAGIVLITVVTIPPFDRINKLKSDFSKGILYILHGLVFCLAHTLLFSLIFELFNESRITDKYFDRFTGMLFTDFHNSVRTYLLLISILFAEDYFNRTTKAIISRKNAENEIGKIKLESLRAQLQPHFLFNALNNVVALIDENKKKAQSLIIDLSDLLRYTINLDPQRMVPVEEEIQLIKRYISIEKSKYEDQLEVMWDIEPHLTGRMVPPLIVQPLIENAVKHGFLDNSNKLKVVISIGQNHIVVRNNGSLLQADKRIGQGLGIVKKRLAVHYGGNHTFKLYMDGDWVVNEINMYEAV